VGQQNWEVEIHGKASHAGVAPDQGISATLVAATALVEAQRGGWFGKVVKPDGTGTSNPGIFGGKDGKAAGDATNVVTDYVYIKGEARSADEKFAAAIVEGYREALLVDTPTGSRSLMSISRTDIAARAKATSGTRPMPS
jgi:tripeptide aminopeptidase